VNANTVCHSHRGRPADANYNILQENLERLKSCPVWKWSRCRCRDRWLFKGMRLPASYANFYIANGVVIVPTFNDPKEPRRPGHARRTLPDREVVGIHCVDLVWGLGTLHCMTQQEPADVGVVQTGLFDSECVTPPSQLARRAAVPSQVLPDKWVAIVV